MNRWWAHWICLSIRSEFWWSSYPAFRSTIIMKYDWLFFHSIKFQLFWSLSHNYVRPNTQHSLPRWGCHTFYHLSASHCQGKVTGLPAHRGEHAVSHVSAIHLSAKSIQKCPRCLFFFIFLWIITAQLTDFCRVHFICILKIKVIADKCRSCFVISQDVIWITHRLYS